MKLVGILNITPDSFSDGGLYDLPKTAVKQLENLLNNQFDVLDIGAISTKPNAKIPTVQEEIKRFDEILPSIIPLLKSSLVEISIDSYNFDTIMHLMDKIKISWINDQSGFKDDRLIDLVKNTNLKLVVMHHLNIPVDPQNVVPSNVNIVDFVKNWLLDKAQYLIKQGVKQEQIILDPGIGFGKTPEQSWELIRKAKSFKELGYSIMYGHSRKSFLNLVTNQDFRERDLETAILSLHLADSEIDYIRVHNIEAHVRALKTREKLKNG